MPMTKRVTAEEARGKRLRRWSAAVTASSDALDLEEDLFKGSARQIAHALKVSSEHSTRRKASPFQSAMSMLTFYENRAGKNLSSNRRTTLERAKKELRRLFGHSPVGRA
jgi:hypothetical protein